jgi:hypothetical protein
MPNFSTGIHQVLRLAKFSAGPGWLRADHRSAIRSSE